MRALLLALLLASLAANAYLWDKWTRAQEHVADKCRYADGEDEVLIANDYFVCWPSG